MAKIKVKKEMELPELLRWASDNGIKDCSINGDQGSNVLFNKNGWVSMNYYVSLEENFEVEVEEEIDENTKIPRILGIYQFENGLIGSNVTHNVSVDVLCKIENITPLAFYMLNDDYTMTLLWKDGEMVE